MKISTNVLDLIEGINIVTRALSPRNANQILEGVLLETENDHIRLTCTDGNMTIEYLNLADIAEPGKAVLPGRLFGELIRKFPKGNIQIETNEGQQFANIKCVKNKSRLSCMNAEEFPKRKNIASSQSIKIQQKELKRMINHVVFAASTNEERADLSGCLLEISHAEARFVALDGFRLSLQKIFQPFELPGNQEIIKMLIPGKVLNEMGKIMPEDEAFCKISYQNGNFSAEFGNIIFCSSLLSGEFVDYRSIMNIQFTTEIKTNTSSLLNAIERASLLAREGKHNAVKLNINENVIKISTNTDNGSMEEEVDINFKGKPLDIAFNAKYLIDVLHNIETEDTEMKFTSSVSPCIITPYQDDSSVYLVLPVRMFH